MWRGIPRQASRRLSFMRKALGNALPRTVPHAQRRQTIFPSVVFATAAGAQRCWFDGSFTIWRPLLHVGQGE